MNNNQISNPKTEVPTGINLNEKDYLNCLLTTLKEIEKNYVTSMTEASNEHLYNSYNSVFEKITNLQRETYELMFKKGWYSLEQADEQKINEKYNTLLEEYQNLEVE